MNVVDHVKTGDGALVSHDNFTILICGVTNAGADPAILEFLVWDAANSTWTANTMLNEIVVEGNIGHHFHTPIQCNAFKMSQGTTAGDTSVFYTLAPRTDSNAK